MWIGEDGKRFLNRKIQVIKRFNVVHEINIVLPNEGKLQLTTSTSIVPTRAKGIHSQNTSCSCKWWKTCLLKVNFLCIVPFITYATF
jgi:hypothetical protein